MADPVQPKAWRIVPHAENPTRGYVILDCDIECTVPIGVGQPISGACKRWGWDGAVTVTPSIDCQRCGWHKTITNGVAN